MAAALIDASTARRRRAASVGMRTPRPRPVVQPSCNIEHGTVLTSV